MPSKNKLLSEIVGKYIKENPITPSMTLAKKIHKENTFITVEQARYAIRYSRGKCGESKREGIGMIELPRSDKQEWLPFYIPEQYKNTLIMSDIHVPYHDEDALKLAVDQAASRKVDSVILNGDIIDCYECSSFLRDPRLRDLRGEVEQTKMFLGWLQHKLPKAKIFYKFGNHENRVDMYVKKNAPALWQMDNVNLVSFLGCVESGITTILDERIIKYGKHLSIVHGHEWRAGYNSPVNPARGLYNKTKSCAIGSHLHTSSSHSEATLGGDIITTWTTGCLSELHPAYARINKWNLGHAIIQRDTSGSFSVENFKIINGKVFPA